MNQPANTPDTPWPVGKVNDQVKGWIERLGYLWVEGQLTKINFKPTWKLSYLTLRDVQQEKSVQLTCPSSMLQSLSAPLKDGDRVIVHGKPAFYAGRGSFSLWTTEIRHVGIGDLLARIEKLRQQLSTEGLFDPARKRPLPYLPHKIGLITGRGSAAERDVMAVAHDRWPAVQFRVLNTAVQGANTTLPDGCRLARLGGKGATRSGQYSFPARHGRPHDPHSYAPRGNRADSCHHAPGN